MEYSGSRSRCMRYLMVFPFMARVMGIKYLLIRESKEKPEYVTDHLEDSEAAFIAEQRTATVSFIVFTGVFGAAVAVAGIYMYVSESFGLFMAWLIAAVMCVMCFFMNLQGINSRILANEMEREFFEETHLYEWQLAEEEWEGYVDWYVKYQSTEDSRMVFRVADQLTHLRSVRSGAIISKTGLWVQGHHPMLWSKFHELRSVKVQEIEEGGLRKVIRVQYRVRLPDDSERIEFYTVPVPNRITSEQATNICLEIVDFAPYQSTNSMTMPDVCIKLEQYEGQLSDLREEVRVLRQHCGLPVDGQSTSAFQQEQGTEEVSQLEEV